MRPGAIVAALLLCAAASVADGGRVRLRQDAGSFAITVFTAPEPLAAGPADISVLVQDRSTGAVLLDARVQLALRGPDARSAAVADARPGANRLLKAALVTLDRPGQWSLRVFVHRGGETAQVSCFLPVVAPASPASAAWPFLALPPLAVALFALRGAIRRRANARG